MKSPKYIVGVGASAGGLEAIEVFFKSMPSDSGLAFVVVQHLSPDYKSLMAELLSKYTRMPVARAAEGMAVEADHVYLIPPKKNLAIFHGKLLLSEQDHSRGINLPIDVFLRSLAEDQEEKSIAVILSGTGSDGSRGIRAVKEAGGMIMVQSEDSAKFDGMPKSAIATGLPDFVLPVEELPTQMLAFVKHPQSAKAAILDTLLTDEEGLTRIFSLLREKSRVDFTYYKPTTVVRRIERRMTVNQIDQLREYVRFLELYPAEVDTLYRELLIGVTNFFRDKEAFDLLRNEIVPDMLERAAGHEIRIWSAGCSSGEEAYSLAILFREVMEEMGRLKEVKIFATDVDRNAVHKAGNGVYPESIAADLNPKLLTKYFNRKDDCFQISRGVREMVVFAQHNLLKDPPFTNIDLVTCRNLLIYLQPVLQKKALELFSFSLKEQGVLFLGASETTGDASDLFDPIHHRWKLYRSKGRRYRSEGNHFTGFNARSHLGPMRFERASAAHGAHDDSHLLERILNGLAGDYVPLVLIVDENMDLIHVVGDSQGYLLPPTGKVHTDITKMAIKELSIPLATGLQKVFKSRDEIAYSNVHIKRDGETRVVQMRMRPLPGRRNQEPLAAVIIEETRRRQSSEETTETYDLDREAAERIGDLEQELQFTRENLQATVEELETSNEELQATNEELLASNEELQSTNEELQSVNEELYTVNAEYQSKIQELTELNNDLDNLLRSSEILTLFLDETLTLRRFTPGVTTLFRLIETDLGRPLSHISHNLRNFDPVAVAIEVQNRGETLEREVDHVEGRSYMMRAMPYRISSTTVSGVVFNFIDITNIHRVEEALKESEERNALARKAANIGTWDWDIASDKLHWSAEIEPMFGFAPGAFNGTYEAFIDCVHPEDRETLNVAVDACIEDGDGYELEHRIIRPDGEVRWILELGDAVRDHRGRPVRMVGVARDITHHKESVSRLQRAYAELASREAMLHGIVVAAPIGIGLVVDRVFQWTNETLHQMTGYSAQEMRGNSARMLYPDQQEFERVGEVKYRQIDERGVGTVKTRWVRKSGEEFRLLLSSSPVEEGDLSKGVIFTAVDSRLCDKMGEDDGRSG